MSRPGSCQEEHCARAGLWKVPLDIMQSLGPVMYYGVVDIHYVTRTYKYVMGGGGGGENYGINYIHCISSVFLLCVFLFFKE